MRCTVRSLKQDQEADRGENGRDPSRDDNKTISDRFLKIKIY
jgi:hypothetical protein